MGNVSTLRRDQAMPGVSLEEKLLWLSKYGKPRITKHSNGWYCCIDVFVNGDGVQFEVKSEFDHPSPCIAADVCIGRLQEALGKLAGGVDAV